MKTSFSQDANGGMTVIELLVVVACVVIMVAMLLPSGSHSGRGPTVRCLMNIKQICLGSLMYADENKGKFAIQVSVPDHGTRDFLDRNQTFPHYQKLAGYVQYLPVLVCPSDRTRHAAESYQSLTDSNISYFLNADVSTNNAAESILAGERQLRANGTPLPHGTFILNTNMNFSWAAEPHRQLGILGFADGHATSVRAPNLNESFHRQGIATVRLAVP